MTKMKATDGTTLGWVDRGVGEPVFLLHSLGTDRALWRHQADALANEYRVVAPDLRGHGETEAPAGRYSLDMLGMDLIAVADAAGVDSFHLVGISLGGQIALWAAINHPGRLRSVVLSNTAAQIGTSEGWQERISVVLDGGMAGISEAVVGRWFADGFAQRHPGRFARAVQVFESTDPEGYVGCCHALADADLRGAVEKVTVPTLLIGGERDVSTPLSDVLWLHERIAGSRLEILPGVAHLPNLENPEKYSALLTDWLSQASLR